MSFAYAVRDDDGSEGSALVRVGVLSDTLSDTTPVTYSDYVRTTSGAPNPVTVTPLINDRDPSQGTLTIISLAPNAPAGSEEYTRLEALIDPATALDKGSVVLASGSVLGTHSYVYTVQSSISTSTAEGLVVVNVSDIAAPDFPVVTDTVVTARTRLELATTGLDVVTGKVQWPSGDVASLTLDIWPGAAGRFTVSGTTITGDLPASGALIPFSLSGTDSTGGTVVSYGFLRIPAFDDMRVQVRATVEPVRVNEEKSVEFALRDLLDLDSADSIQVRRDEAFTVQRANASCSPSGASRASYSAGREAPWVDSCTIPVRITGQASWTMVSIPIAIVPKDPQAILNSVTRTISPGASESVDLYANMTTWEGGRVGDVSKLDYTISSGGPAFIVSQAGNGVSIDTRADAAPGTRSTITVSTSAYGGLTAAITLIVGVAPPDAPRGATFTQQCDVSKGSSCSITVAGVTGEYDPFAGKVGSGLRVTSVGTGSPVVCPIATVSVSGATQVVATWPSGARPVGGTCVVPFTVADAQGRTGTGQLTIDVLGYPQTPASVTTQSYTASSVTMYIDLGNAVQAHPSVTGAALFEGGTQVATCTAAPPTGYTCTVGGLDNGAIHNYTAQAINSVGNSGDTTAVKTNAYRAPQISSITTTPVYVPGTTTESRGVTTVQIQGGTDLQSGRVVNTGEVIQAGQDKNITLDEGNQLLRIIPISRFSPPLTGSNEGSESTKSIVVVSTATYPGGASATRVSDTSLRLDLSNPLDEKSSPVGKNELFVASQSAGVTCTGNGAAVSYSGGSSVVTSLNNPTISGLTPNKLYWLSACGSNGFGVTRSAEVATNTVVVPAAGPTGGDLTYGVSTSADTSNGGLRYDWNQVLQPSVDDPGPDYFLQYRVDGVSTGNAVQLDSGTIPGSVSVVACAQIVPAACGPATAITVRAGTLPTTAWVAFPSCASDQDWPPPNYSHSLLASAASYPQPDPNVVLFITTSWNYRVSIAAGTQFAALATLDTAEVPNC